MKMKWNMPFSEYLNILKGHSNRPLTLNRLTLPFGVISGSQESETLLVGHVLDELASRMGSEQTVDCIDVVAAAFELGHEPAGPFLDEVPYIISRMVQTSAASNLN